MTDIIVDEEQQKLLKKSKNYTIVGIILIIVGALLSLFIIGFALLIPGICLLTKSSKTYYNAYVAAQTTIEEQNKIITPEIVEAANLKQLKEKLNAEIESSGKKVSELESQIDELNTLVNLKNLKNSLDNGIKEAQSEIQKLNKTIKEHKNNLIVLDDEILMQEFGIYKPTYDFTNSDEYRSKLEKVRSEQKTMVREKTAATGNNNWTVNGSAAQGRKMVNDNIKLLLRAFNGECDSIIDRVKYNNFESSLKRITASRDAISKLGNVMDISISQRYYELKIDELRLAFEYRQKKQEEKEHQKELRAQMREEAKLQKEIEAERKKIEKEQQHYQNVMNMLNAQLETAQGEEREALINKKNDVLKQLTDIGKAIKDIDYREANQRAGYVYIISNIGSFGENVYKIGMTRRLDPTERVSELGDASVPFNFDIHAMIFSDDAPALEAALHRAFEDKKLNMVNTRREFFNVSLDEIKEVVKKNFDKTVEFIEVPDAEQYRISQKMRSAS